MGRTGLNECSPLRRLSFGQAVENTQFALIRCTDSLRLIQSERPHEHTQRLKEISEHLAQHGGDAAGINTFWVELRIEDSEVAADAVPARD